MRTNRIGPMIAVVMSACAVVVTTLLVRREFSEARTVNELRTVSNWRDYAIGGQQLGTEGAPVEVVVFSDFQCSFCALLAKRFDTLAAQMPGRASIRFRHFPVVNLHPQARLAAMASECAGEQDRFKPYHDVLFEKQDSIVFARWTQFALLAGVRDTVRFRDCMRDSVPAARVQKDIDAGVALHVPGTPAVLVNDRFHRGAPSVERLLQLVEGALARTPELRSGTAGRPGVAQDQASLSEACFKAAEPRDHPQVRTRELESRFGRPATERILRGEVCVGMTSDMVRSAWGPPLIIGRKSRDRTSVAEWKYSSQLVLLEDDTVAVVR